MGCKFLKISKNKASLLLLIFIFLTFFSQVFSQETTNKQLEINYPEFAGVKLEDKISLTDYALYIFRAAIAIIGFTLLAAFLWAGYIYLTSAGNPNKIKEARDRITSAVFGVLILLSGYIILNIINPDLKILKLPSIKNIVSNELNFRNIDSKEVLSLISKELPLGDSIDGENGIFGSKTKSEVRDYLNNDFSAFLNEEILKDQVGKSIKAISDLNKYLTTLVNQCQCGELEVFCTKIEHGSMPVGCSGDPCPQEVRREIEKVVQENQKRIALLLQKQKSILNKREDFVKKLRALGEIEQEMLSCAREQKGLYSLREYLQVIQDYEEQGYKISTLTKSFKKPGDFLSFYCPVGGTTTDVPNISYDIKSSLEDISQIFQGFSSQLEEQKISCPVQIPVGEIQDKFRQLGVVIAVKMERTVILVDRIIGEIRDMINLVSECGAGNCKPQCSCIYNPCFGICGPESPCDPICRKLCLQGVGECVPKDPSKNPCDKKAMDQKVKDIKWTEDEIFESLDLIEKVFSEADSMKTDLENIRASLSLCSGPITEETLLPEWILLDCQTAKGEYGPSGRIIGYCHPRNFYCCTPSQIYIPQSPSYRAAKIGVDPSTLGNIPNFPKQIRERSLTIVEPKKFPPLSVNENNCPAGWECENDVKIYNQYNDASDPLKELLSCMKYELDSVKKRKNIKTNIGVIANITDPKLYIQTCDWGKGPLQENGCSFAHETKEGKINISSHYGGSLCYWQKKSYAVDLRVASLEEKKYVQDIIEAAKKCNPSAYIQYGGLESPNRIHISIASANNCGAN